MKNARKTEKDARFLVDARCVIADVVHSKPNTILTYIARQSAMDNKRGPNPRLLRLAMRDGVTQLLAASICTGVLFLFVALTYSRITLPAYTADYDQKDTQQVVNLLITVVATIIGILLSHCRR